MVFAGASAAKSSAVEADGTHHHQYVHAQSARPVVLTIQVGADAGVLIRVGSRRRATRAVKLQ